MRRQQLPAAPCERVVQMPDQQPNRYIPAHVEAFPYRLPNFANRLNGPGSIKIKIDATRRMQSPINQLATAVNVNVFHRFDLMRKFLDVERHSFDSIIDPTDTDRLHQSDFSARRIGYELSEAIAAGAAHGGQAPAG